MKNQDIRTAAKAGGIYLWQIADKLNMNDSAFSRKLRKELPTEEKNQINTIIKELRKTSYKKSRRN